MDKFTCRDATSKDIPFLVDTIIEAEKSGTTTLTYSTIFGISEEDARKYMALMLAEEVDGCEFSISSYLIAETENQIAAAISAWIEGAEGIPSTVLKGNLLNYILPKDALGCALSVKSILSDLHIENIPNTIQIGLVYVAKAFRGQNLVRLLIEKQINNLCQKNTKPMGIYIQVYGNNLAAIRAYEKADFRKVLVRKSTDDRVINYMPSDNKILMKREL